MLLTTFPIAFIEHLSRSITGEILSLPDVMSKFMNKDFAPDNSFVSLVGDAIILLVSKSKFSFNGIADAVVSVEKDVSDPLGLVPLVVLIDPFTDVLFKSSVEI